MVTTKSDSCKSFSPMTHPSYSQHYSTAQAHEDLTIAGSVSGARRDRQLSLASKLSPAGVEKPGGVAKPQGHAPERLRTPAGNRRLRSTGEGTRIDGASRHSFCAG